MVYTALRDGVSVYFPPASLYKRDFSCRREARARAWRLSCSSHFHRTVNTHTDLDQAARGRRGHRMYRLQPSLSCLLSSSPVASTSYASYSAASSSSSCIAGASSLRQRQKQQQRWSSRAAYTRPTTTSSSYSHASRKNGIALSLPALFHPSPSSITSTFFFKSSSSYPSSCIRCFAHLANRQDSTSSTTDPKSPSSPASSKSASTATSTPTPAANPSQTLGKSSNLTIDTAPASKETNNKEQRLRDIQIIKRLLPNIWPKGDTGTKARVVIAIALLIGGKVRQ